MAEEYRIRVVSRCDVLEYRDEVDTYWFDIWLDGQEWTVYLPCSKTAKAIHRVLDT